jgi:hypothetical protein
VIEIAAVVVNRCGRLPLAPLADGRRKKAARPG